MSSHAAFCSRLVQGGVGGTSVARLFAGDAQDDSHESKCGGAICGSIGLTALGVSTMSLDTGDGRASEGSCAHFAALASCRRKGNFPPAPWRFAKTSVSCLDTKPEGHQPDPISACLPMLLCLIMTSVTSIFLRDTMELKLSRARLTSLALQHVVTFRLCMASAFLLWLFPWPPGLPDELNDTLWVRLSQSDTGAGLLCLQCRTGV